MEELLKIIDSVPPDYKWIGVITIALLPYITRGFYALKNNGGLKGVLDAILFGTNAPRKTKL